jgi:chlorophyll synthase
MINDIYDQKIDRISNSKRPLITKKFNPGEYRAIGIVSFLLSIFFASIVSFKIALFLIAYQGIAWAYSAPPLRLKKFAVLSTLASSVALLMILFCGFVLTDPNQSLQSLSKNIIWLLLIALTISLPIKDLKDIKGDKKDRIYTIPVLLGEYWGKTIIASSIFMSFILSAIFLNEFRLFWWAMLFGGLSFWTIQYSEQTKLITYRNINWWLLSILLAYTIILIFTVFV